MTKYRRTKAWAALWAAMMALSASLSPALAQGLHASSFNAALAAPAVAVADPSDEIVYIGGGDDLIRVLDPTTTNVEVKWVSPIGGFREVAVGDVNNDGDMEIIGIRGDNPNGEVIVYDPVIATGSFSSSQKINGIPWAELARIPLGVTPTLILAGDFDPNVPGDEFVVGGMLPGNLKEGYELNIYKNASTTSAGKEWAVHVGPKKFEGVWSRGTVGNVIVEPSAQFDEFAMINEDGGVLMAYSMANGFDNILTVGDEAKKFRDVAMGQWSQGTAGKEIVAVREATGLVNAFYWEFSADVGLEEKDLDTFDPAFRRVTMTDVNASGDDEIYLLRDVPAGIDKPRLVSRNSGVDGATEFEETLEDDNRWRALTSGDINGDGKGDVIIGSENKIAVYTNAARDSDNRDEYNVSTNKRSIVAGNLDAIGFMAGPEFEVDQSSVTATAGTEGTADVILHLKNKTTADAIPFIISAEGSPAWLTVNGQAMNVSPYQATGNTFPDSNATPIQLRFDAQGLTAGVYRSRLVIDSSAEVTNKPLEVVLTFNVLAAELKMSPGSIYVGTACTGTTEITQTTQISVTGLQGLQYTASVLEGFVVEDALDRLGGSIAGASLDESGALRLEGAGGAAVTLDVGAVEVNAAAVSSIAWPSGAPWVSASSIDGVVLDTLTVTTTVSASNNDFQLAYVLLFGDPRAGSPPQNIRLLPVIACSTSALLPAVLR